MKAEWNLPNFLSLLRMLLVVPIGWLLLSGGTFQVFLALAIYGIAAFTDTLDGIAARKLGLESPFGAWFDPFADKVLVWGVFTLLCLRPELGIPLWLIAPIYLRDLYITYIRSIAGKQGVLFRTSFLAKAKTLAQMVVIALLMGYLLLLDLVGATATGMGGVAAYWTGKAGAGWIAWLPFSLTAATVLFTIYTGIDYTQAYLREKGRKNG